MKNILVLLSVSLVAASITKFNLASLDVRSQDYTLIISEINYAGSVNENNCKLDKDKKYRGCSYDKWVEIYNPTDQNIDLKNWMLRFKSSSLARNNFVFSNSYILSPQKTLILGNGKENNFKSTLVASGSKENFFSGKILKISNNTNKTVQASLINPNGNRVFDVDLNSSKISYFESLQDPENKYSIEFNPNTKSWQNATTSYYSKNYGTPGKIPSSHKIYITTKPEAQKEPVKDLKPVVEKVESVEAVTEVKKVEEAKSNAKTSQQTDPILESKTEASVEAKPEVQKEPVKDLKPIVEKVEKAIKIPTLPKKLTKIKVSLQPYLSKIKSSKQLVIPTKTPNNIQIPTYTTKNNQKLAQTLESIQQNNSLPIIKKPKTNSFDAISRDLVGEPSPKQTKLQPVVETKPPKLTQVSLENNLNFDLLKISSLAKAQSQVDTSEMAILNKYIKTTSYQKALVLNSSKAYNYFSLLFILLVVAGFKLNKKHKQGQVDSANHCFNFEFATS